MANILCICRYRTFLIDCDQLQYSNILLRQTQIYVLPIVKISSKSPFSMVRSLRPSERTLKIARVMDLKKSPDVAPAPNVNTPSTPSPHPLSQYLIKGTMPRSVTDATRFTSTTPHASAKIPPNPLAKANAIPPRTPGPPGETPQEKVRRLRAAADRARDAQVSSFDKVIARGRVWADKAHRFTALSLIGITGMLTLAQIP
jgi:hypothetical protein